MNRKQFIKALEKENDKNSQIHGWCKMFFNLNERPEVGLSKKQIQDKEEMKAKILSDKSLMEDYYLFHICLMYDSKWITATPEDLATHWYKNSEKIKAIYDGLSND